MITAFLLFVGLNPAAPVAAQAPTLPPPSTCEAIQENPGLKSDCSVLLSVRDTLAGGTDLLNWSSSTPMSAWTGVTISGTPARVAEIDLTKSDLTGTIPPELGKLTELRSLNLYFNDLTGEVPPELGSLSKLRELHLNRNALRGEIPPELGNLSNLNVLRLDNNDLSGEIPSELGNLSGLEFLYLHFNGLTGEIPPELGNLTELIYLSLFANRLTGEIPPELGNLTELIYLDLLSNDLTGEIPPELGNLSRLEFLYLDHNALTGEIPPELGNLSELRFLELDFNDLRGEIPPELGSLSKLRELHLGRNALRGEIPPELGSLSKLRALHMHKNALRGEIPPELGNLSRLEFLYLDHNALTGEIPPELGDLSELRLLGLNNNDLSGEIPPELGNLSRLELLYLDSNALRGEIPPELGDIGLSWLRLGHNDLAGCIPDSLEDPLQDEDSVGLPFCSDAASTLVSAALVASSNSLSLGDRLTLTANVATHGSLAYTCQFQVQLENSSHWWNSGPDSAACARDITKDYAVNYRFRVVVSASDQTLTSDPVPVSWTDASLTSLTISTSAESVGLGDSITLSAHAAGGEVSEATYQFQVQLAGETRWWNSGPLSSATTRTITKTYAVAYTFRVLATVSGATHVSSNTVPASWSDQ